MIGGGKTTAGLFDDPFFFDLDAFKGAVLGNGNGRTFCDGDTHDFFLGLNISALVLRVPNSSLGGNGKAIGVWATTVDSHWQPARPDGPAGDQHRLQQR